MSGEVIGADRLTDQQREGARLATAGWRGVDIAEHLGVAPETASRWRKKTEYIAAIKAISSESRSAGGGRMVELTDKALDVIDETLGHPCDSGLEVRVAVALLQISGIWRVMSSTVSTKGASISESAVAD